MSQSTSSQNSNSPKKFRWLSSATLYQVSDVLNAGLLAANWIYPLYHLIFGNLPPRIPMQYSFNGGVNWSGSKYLILLLSVGAAYTYYESVHQPINAKGTLYLKSVPEGQSTQKLATLAKTLTKLRGLISQSALLAGSVLVVKGILATKETRATWIKNGIITGVLALVVTYGGVYFNLRKPDTTSASNNTPL